MTVLRADDLILPAVGKFGPCVVSVGYYNRLVNPGSLKEVAGMSKKERDQAAKWLHGVLVKWGYEAGRSVDDIRAEYFAAGENVELLK